MKSENKGYIYAGLTILFWGTSASAFKIGLKYMDYFQLLFIATLTAVVFLFGVLLYQKKLILIKQFSIKDYSHSMLSGFLNPFLYYTVLFIAYTLLPAQVAQPLNFVWPIALVLLSIPILKQKLELKSMLALLISFVGVIVISTEGNMLNMKFANPLGVSLALLSSVVWALFWLYNLKDNRDEILRLFFNFVFGLVFITLATVLFSEIKVPSLEGLLAGVYIGLFEMGITFVLWLKALKLAGRTDKISNLIYLTPFCSLVFISIFLNEKIYLTTLFGLFLIVTGIIIQQVKRKNHKPSRF
ncbi:MAG: DMT family transporter [Bacteroidales bacterium]|jgi:drug/metabolite transporter (DMT)-like permease|nr:DMT family transporter [Bacteroidales bacterium]